MVVSTLIYQRKGSASYVDQGFLIVSKVKIWVHVLGSLSFCGPVMDWRTSLVVNPAFAEQLGRLRHPYDGEQDYGTWKMN